MKVGLDARALCSPVRSGVEHYVANLARALAALPDLPEIVAYLDRPIPEPEALGRLRTAVVRAPRGWLRAALPWRLWRDRVDVAHFPSTVLPPLLPCPAVVTVHDLAWRRHPETYAPDDLAMQRVALRSALRAAAVIAVSRSTASDLAEMGVAEDRIAVVPLGVAPVFRPEGPRLAPDAFAGAEKLAAGYLLHLATGGPHPRKNVSRLLETYAALRSSGSVPPLVIAGDVSSPRGRELVQQAARLGLAEQVVFPGQVEEALLPALYRGAVLLVYPSLYEGFGLPILEAMASGTPVITSDRSSMAEVAGDAALLVDPESVEALAAAMARALADETLRRDLRKRGLERSRSYPWERTARETVSVYRLAGGRSRLP